MMPLLDKPLFPKITLKQFSILVVALAILSYVALMFFGSRQVDQEYKSWLADKAYFCNMKALERDLRSGKPLTRFEAAALNLEFAKRGCA